MSATAPLCSICGGYPAVHVSFRAVVVIVIGMAAQTRADWFCRECGTAVFREQTKYTLVAGWWGIPAPATVVFLLLNLSERGKLQQLPAPRHLPVPPEGAGPRYGRPLPPGRPVRSSPALVVPVLLVALLLFLCVGPGLFS